MARAVRTQAARATSRRHSLMAYSLVTPTYVPVRLSPHVSGSDKTPIGVHRQFSSIELLSLLDGRCSPPSSLEYAPSGAQSKQGGGLRRKLHGVRSISILSDPLRRLRRSPPLRADASGVRKCGCATARPGDTWQVRLVTHRGGVTGRCQFATPQIPTSHSRPRLSQP